MNDTIAGLILEIATLVVDDPSSVSLYVHEGSEITDLVLTLNQEDEIKMVGPGATLIRAIRSFLGCVRPRYPQFRLTLITHHSQRLESVQNVHNRECDAMSSELRERSAVQMA